VVFLMAAISHALGVKLVREREREKFICHIIISQHKYKCNDKCKQRQAARKEVPSQLATYDNYNQ